MIAIFYKEIIMLHPRARTMLLLAPPALIIGVASSLILIVIMKVAAVLQSVLWTSLPSTVGLSASSPTWVILILTLTGIAVGLVIRYSPGHAGPDPATEPLIGAPVDTAALPGLIIALIIGLAGGVSLGPEHPVMAVNIALAVAVGSRILPRVNTLDLDHSRLGGHHRRAVRHTRCGGADIFPDPERPMPTSPLWDRLFAPLLSAAAGALTTSLFFHPHFFIAHRPLQPDAAGRYL
ncbi:putative ion channel protein [Leclercia adecarboxylata]|uniref:Putative ion channel protein n=1 Tax=Leclercia adecarboxylata TaxID=83655 RepID=A0A4U9I7S3_9ENTR|nr:putative ion channel protein [Leclercia adecarboxylata]